jgi:hypothetical protein
LLGKTVQIVQPTLRDAVSAVVVVLGKLLRFDLKTGGRLPFAKSGQS